jgi:hypothetical protein
VSQTKAQLLDGSVVSVEFSAGSVGAPSLYFTGDTNTGIYSPGADQVAISTNGTGRLLVSNTSAILPSGSLLVGQSTNPFAYTFIANTGSGASNNAASFTNNADAGLNIKLTSGVSFVDASTGILALGTSNTERLRIDSSGNVGIGTSAPNYQLHATTSFAVGAAGFNQQLSFTNDTIQSLVLGSGYTPLKLNPLGGNVGIGTSSPGEPLHVNGNVSLRTSAFASNGYLEFGDSGTVYSKVGRFASSGDLFLGTLAGNSNTTLQSAGTGAVIFNAGGASERARIDSSGRLLVGTSTGRGLGGTIQASTQVETTTYVAYSAVNNTNDTGGSALMFGKSRGTAVGSNTIVQNNDNLGDIYFAGADGTDLESIAARITCTVDGTPGANDMPGRLVFSTTADGAASPTERMRIDNAGFTNTFSANNAFAARSSIGAGTSILLYGGYYSATSTTSGTNSYVVWTNGNVVNTNGSYGALSDIKLKENIVDANSQWDDLKALQVRNYNFKEGQTHTQIGLVAQEVELVSPGLVTESPDRDAEGNDLGTVTKSVSYSVLYMKAVKALQEAMERIETLEAKVAALESQ